MESPKKKGDTSSVKRLRYLYQPWTLLVAFYRAKIITVEPAVVFFNFAMDIYTPLYQQYYYQNYGAKLLQNTSFIFPNSSFCLTTDMIINYTGNNETYKLDQSYSNNLVAYGQIANKVPSIIAALLLGPLTDRFGRKIGVCLPAVGCALQGILAIFIIKYDLNPYYFILAKFISGSFGHYIGILASSYSYVADISSPRWRSLRIGIIDATSSFASSAGTYFGGYWLNNNHCNFIPPLFLYVACNLFVVAYVVLLVPESFTRSERKKLVSKKGIRMYIQGFRLYCGGLPPLSTWKVYVATIMLIVTVMSIMGNVLVYVYFLRTPPFDLNPQQIGIYPTIKNISEGVANIVIIGLLAALKVNDIWTMLIAVLVNGGCNVLIGFSNRAWQIYTIASFEGIEGIGYTGARTLMSKLTKPEIQGSLFAIIASVEAVTELVAGAFWPFIYPIILRHNMRSGMIYIFMAVLEFTLLPLIGYRLSPWGVLQKYKSVATSEVNDL